MEKKEIQIKTYNLSKPEEMSNMALVLKDYIIKKNLSVAISGKRYIMVEGWQFAGGLMGLFPRITEVKELGENRWMARAEIIGKDDKIMSVGYATCSKTENKKKTFDEYAILSMAQTRAIGKAYRNLIGWVMKTAGYESTPAEEMKSDQPTNNQPDFKEANDKLSKATNLVELQKIWKSLSAIHKQNPEVEAFKDELKTKLQ